MSAPLVPKLKGAKAPTPIAHGYRQRTNKVLAGIIRKTDAVLRMKATSRGHKPVTGAMKRLKRVVKGAAVSSLQKAVKVRRNDPLAIGIEELERSFWPPASSRRRLS